MEMIEMNMPIIIPNPEAFYKAHGINLTPRKHSAIPKIPADEVPILDADEICDKIEFPDNDDSIPTVPGTKSQVPPPVIAARITSYNSNTKETSDGLNIDELPEYEFKVSIVKKEVRRETPIPENVPSPFDLEGVLSSVPDTFKESIEDNVLSSVRKPKIRPQYKMTNYGPKSDYQEGEKIVARAKPHPESTIIYVKLLGSGQIFSNIPDFEGEMKGTDDLHGDVQYNGIKHKAGVHEFYQQPDQNYGDFMDVVGTELVKIGASHPNSEAFMTLVEDMSSKGYAPKVMPTILRRHIL